MVVFSAFAALLLRAQVRLDPPIITSTNTLRLVVNGPTTNIRYDVYFTNALGASAATWPLLATGGTNQVVFDLMMPDANAGFFIVTSNYVAGTNPPPQVATPVFSPASFTGNTSVTVTVTCDTPGAVTYFTTNGAAPTTGDNYIASGGKLLIQRATTLKARAFRGGFLDSQTATGTYNVNAPPFVFVGSQQITSGTQVTLGGYTSDDGQTQPLSNYWRQISGPGSVTFDNRNLTNTTATLPQDGIFVLQLEAFDGYWTTIGRVTVARNPAIAIALTAPVGSSAFNVPTNVALEASTVGSSVTITQVQFYAGSTLLGTDTAAPWTYEWRNLPAGDHSLYAVATSSDPNNFSLASDAVNITVNFPTDIGRFTLASTDLQIPVAGLPIVINRSHDPRHGSGWSFGENMRLDFEGVRIEKSASLGSGYTALRTGGQDCLLPNHQTLVTISLSPTEQYYFRPRIVFQAGGGAACVGSSSATHSVSIRFVFDPVGSLGGELASIDAPGDVGMISEGSWQGQWYGTAQACTDDGFGSCDQSYEPDWSLFTFTAPDGTHYKFDASGKLFQRIDRNSNSLTYDWSGITHSSGKLVSFTRDGYSRITEVYDPTAIANGSLQPAIRYDYDDNGNLTNVARLVDRSGAGTYETNAYRYDDATQPHLITRVIDPRGITTVSNVFDSSGRLTRQYDALGRYTAFAYEDNGRRQVVTDRNSRTSRQDFTEAGQVERVQDAEGAVTSYTYDANGRPIAQVNPLGAINSFAYNERDELIGVTNGLSYSSSSTYNAFGQPLEVVDAMGYGATNGYDDNGNLVAVTNALGIVSRYGYDTQGNRIAETNAFGLPEQAVTLTQYDEFGYATNLTDARGFQTAFTYDANGNQMTVRRERTLASGSTQVLWTTNDYDAANRVLAVVESDGFTNRSAYNGLGKVAYTTNKLGVVTRFDYDTLGLLTNSVFALATAQQANEASAYDAEGRRTNTWDRLQHQTSYTYDGLGRLRRTTFADGAYTENQYDVGGRLYATLQGPKPVGGPSPPVAALTTRYQYDAAGRRTAIIDTLSETNRYAYDANGNQTNFVDALGRTVRYDFDRLNRQTKLTYPDTTTEGYGYDALNRKLAVTNQAGIVARFGYDKLGQLVAATNAFGSGTVQWATYAYDQVGNQTNQVDALGRQTRFEYDVLSRRVKESLPGTQTQSFAYDATGNLIRHTNFNGIILTNQYDALNRLTNKTSINGYQIRYAYSATGQRTNLVDASGASSYTYDTRDRLMTKSTSQGTLTYSYDDFGNLKSIASATASGVRLSYAYDALNRLTNVQQSSVIAGAYGYDDVGNLKTVRYGNAVTNTYAYDALNRLTNLTATSSGGTVASFAYKLTAAGNRTNLTETISAASRAFAWQYDPLSRLTNETITASAPTGTISYKYDPVGNRTNRTSNVTGLGNQSLSYNTNDWLTTDVYDSNGNTRTNGNNVFAYDAENRLTNYNNGAATYVYDADGNRVRKNVGTTTTLYLVDDRNPSGYAQVLEELTVSGGGTNLSKVYAYGLDLLTQRDGSSGTTYYFGYDGNGNTRYLTATNASVVNVFAYDAFGTLIASNATPQTDYLFTGEQRDATLGLVYLRNRYLNSETGRFWTRDTATGNTQDPFSLHRYLYVRDNPVNATDPTGFDGELGSALSAASISASLQGFRTTVSVALIRSQLAAISALNTYGPLVLAGTAGVSAALTVIDQGAQALLRNSTPIPPGNFPRGRLIEETYGANLAGNFPRIDDWRPNIGLATSVRSHNLQSVEAYITAIEADAGRLVDIEKMQLAGYTSDANGHFLREILPGEIRQKALVVAIPEAEVSLLQNPQVRVALQRISETSRAIIRLVPVKGWKR